MTNDRGTAVAARESAAQKPRDAAFLNDQLVRARREAGAAAAALALACRGGAQLDHLAAATVAACRASAELRMSIRAVQLAS